MTVSRQSEVQTDSLPISALQHYVFCPRQFALIHIERLWAENRLTAEGQLLHQRSDSGKKSRRRGVNTSTSVPLRCTTLRIHGVADVVEFHDGKTQSVVPVEYKRGKPKRHQADEVQLCAQALCLESMLNKRIDSGILYYAENRRRSEVNFDDKLRTLTEKAIHECWALIDNLKTPTIPYDTKRCKACSLKELCQPHTTGKARSAQSWFWEQLTYTDATSS
ncbi:CRISPR-associated protein Cas4 [Chromatiales bacterium (ex Bugula neritina AB1)]|nr:CRISPR-associated protein Cas4 [Chromatiales bacterium (ex Bugula neritina AB1)]